MAALLVAATLLETPRAFACSPGPDFNPVAESDVIVEGRFLGYDVLAEASPPGDFVPVRVEMAVARVLKGQVAADTIDVVDDRTLRIFSETGEAWGGGGSCGAFGSDPTGKYAILGLNSRPDGSYAPSLPLTFFIGDAPSGESYDRALTRLASFGGVLPDTGSGAFDSRSTDLATIGKLAAVGAAVFTLGGLLLLASRRYVS